MKGRMPRLTRRPGCVAVAALVDLSAASAHLLTAQAPVAFEVTEKSIYELQAAPGDGRVTSVQLVERFRRIEVRVRSRGLRAEARRGYYAARDFAHTNRRDREAQLEELMDASG